MSARAVSVSVTPDVLEISLDDGRTIAAPLAWLPRLVHGTVEERAHARLAGQGEGLRWPDLDEDVSVEALTDARVCDDPGYGLWRFRDDEAAALRNRAFCVGRYYV